MSALSLIEAVQTGNSHAVRKQLNDGVNVNQADDYGWTALHWAAGRGDTALIEMLLQAGANLAETGRDNRTPYHVALAAGQIQSAALLQQAQQLEPHNASYCKAYPISAMRQFANWGSDELPDQAIVYLHDDLTVTRCIWRNEAVLFASPTDDWQQFCSQQLAFFIPTDLTLAEAE